MTKEEAIAVFECLATEMTAILAGIPKSEAAANQIKRYIDAYDIAISALRIKQKQESECTKCSGIMYRQTDSGKIIPVGQRCGAKNYTSLLRAGWRWMCLSNLWRQQR